MSVILYYIFPLVALFLTLFKVDSKYKYIYLMLLVLFICFGYMTGTDWRVYELLYNQANFNFESNSKEIGFYSLISVFNYIGVSYWIFVISLKIFVFVFLVLFVRELNINIWFYLFLFLPDNGYFLFIDNPLRNFIAYGFVYLSFHYLMKGSYKIFFLLFFLALSFHYSSIVVLLMFFFRNKTFRNRTIIVATLILIAIAFSVDLMMSFYLKLALSNPLINERLSLYIVTADSSSVIFNPGTIVKFIVLLLVLKNRKVIETEIKYGNIIITFFTIYMFIYPFSISFIIFQRFAFFYQPFYYASVIILFYVIRGNILKFVFLSVFVVLSFYKLHSTITSDYRYVPYSNYLFYCMKGDLPDYQTRDSYNKIGSPYKTKKK